MDLKRILFVICRYKVAIGAFVLASLLATSGFALLTPATYEANAQILVKVGREISAPSQDILEGGGFVTPKRREDIFAEVEILQSQHVVEQVVNEIGPEMILHGKQDPSPDESPSWLGGLLSFGGGGLSPTEQAIERLQADITIEAVIRSDTIRMRYANKNPELALLVVDTLLAKYLERHIEVHKGGHMGAVFEPQVDQYAKELAELEDEISTLEKEKNVFSFDAQQSELIHQKMAARADLEETRRAIAAQASKVKRIEKQIASSDGIIELPGAQDQSTGIDTIRARLVEMELNRKQMEQSSHTRDIETLTAEITRAKELLTEEEQRVLYSNRMELGDLKRRKKALEADIEEYKVSLREIEAVDHQRNKLERERTITEQNYLLYVGELEQARISAVMDVASITNVRVLQPATVASAASGPSMAMMMAVTLMLSGLLGVAAVFLLNYLDHSIKTAEDIEVQLGLPVMGSIAEKEDRTLVAEGYGRPIPSDPSELSVAANLEPGFQELADNILLLKSQRPLQTLAVASSVAGEGTSTLAAGLAISLAKSGSNRILLVDCNFRSPSLCGRLGSAGKPGLTDGLLGDVALEECLIPSGLPNLILATSGNLTSDSRRVLTSDEFKTFLGDISGSFSLVILDSAPINSAQDSAILSTLVDGLLLVIQAEQTNYEVIARAQERIAGSGGNIVGAVLNRRRYHIPETLYRRM